MRLVIIVAIICTIFEFGFFSVIAHYKGNSNFLLGGFGSVVFNLIVVLAIWRYIVRGDK